ncbi:MAG: flagellar protein FlaG [Candidatus Marinimicrobia bacterium]|nr:flagellar protein FlaG [Candidatus Neomarinimicrobiota bacterium]
MEKIGSISSSSLPKIKVPEANTIKNKKVDHDLALNDKSDADSMRVARPDLDIPELVSKVNQFIHSFSTKLSFHYDDRVSRPIIRVIDKETGEVLRQIPPEEWIKRLRHLNSATGIVLRQKA